MENHKLDYPWFRDWKSSWPVHT